MTKTESEILYELITGRNVQIHMVEKRRLKTLIVLRDACLVDVLKTGDFLRLKIRNNETTGDYMTSREVRETVKEWSKAN